MSKSCTCCMHTTTWQNIPAAFDYPSGKGAGASTSSDTRCKSHQRLIVCWCCVCDHKQLLSQHASFYRSVLLCVQIHTAYVRQFCVVRQSCIKLCAYYCMLPSVFARDGNHDHLRLWSLSDYTARPGMYASASNSACHLWLMWQIHLSCEADIPFSPPLHQWRKFTAPNSQVKTSLFDKALLYSCFCF